MNDTKHDRDHLYSRSEECRARSDYAYTQANLALHTPENTSISVDANCGVDVNKLLILWSNFYTEATCQVLFKPQREYQGHIVIGIFQLMAL